METNNNDPPKATTSATQVAYLRLDPILRTLLNLITQYREQTETNNDDEQQIIGLLRAQTNILTNQLQQTIQQLDPPSLIVLAQYLSLPLLLLLLLLVLRLQDLGGCALNANKRSEVSK